MNKLKITIRIAAFLFFLAVIFKCSAPLIDDGTFDQRKPKITITSAFYANVNPYCCIQRGMDSAAVVREFLQRYGEILTVTLLPNDTIVDAKPFKINIKTLANQEEINGDNKYSNCETLNATVVEMAPGAWTLSYEVIENGMKSTEIQLIEVRTNTFLNCFRIF